MRNFLIKKFIKNSDNVEDPAVRESYGKLAGAVGIASNSLLCAIKILAGLLFGSIAILADGINNLSDASASLFTLIGFKLSGKAPDKDHPYGHGRTEYLAGLAVSVMVLFIGLQLLKSSFEKTLHPDPPVFSWLSVAIMMAAILIKLWQAGFNRAIGKRIASKALTATAADSRNDVITGGAVLLSTLVYKFFGLDFDGPAGILVAVFIIIS
ncbi:MAG TPA: cation diffusion facilitator family transporter, partial [Bacillota bacterium]|nr:cation diffusion facilitator family transporter [Bacillota bacterium]